MRMLPGAGALLIRSARLLVGLLAAGGASVACASVPAERDLDQSAEVVAVEESVTFSKQVVRLMQEHCQSCHRPDGHAPFSLMTFAEAKPFARAIKNAVATRRMPQGRSIRVDTDCWDEDRFEGPRRLTDAEIDIFVRWVDGGAPEGNASDLPPPLVFPPPAEWTAGEPDVVIANAEAGFTLPARLGRDIFRRFVIPTDFESDRFLTGFEAHPGTTTGEGLARIVHHVTLFVDPERYTIEQEKQFAVSNPEVPGPGFEGDWQASVTPALLGMWFPGSAPVVFPSDLGFRIPRGAALVMEVHYADSPEVVIDRTVVGLHFAKTAVAKEITSSLVKNEQFTIPAGELAFRVDAARTFPTAMTLHAIVPHMHQLGTDFKITIERPADGPSCLADVQWDFEHQGMYRLKTPIVLPAGSTIRTTCLYDNSAANEHQFHSPPQDVPFGKASDKEMCQLTIGTSATP